MKSLGRLVITWVWWAIIVEPMLVMPSIVTKETISLGYNSVSFNLGEAYEYPTFIQDLRNELAKGTPVCQLPVTLQTIADDKRFVLVDLTTTSKKTVKVAIDVTDVYVVGYQDKWNGEDRAVFLDKVPTVATSKLFPGVTNRVTLTFDGSYQKLVNAAKVDRKDLELGVYKLEFAIEAIHGKTINGQEIAKFFLIVIQMVSEAARFKYIETEVVDRGLYGSFKPNFKVLNLENNWGDISDAIHKSSPQCTTINPALQLISPSNDPWVVNKVSQISPDMGILKFKSSKLTQFATMIRSAIVEDLDGDELEILEPNIA